jgi:putative transposase
MSELFKNKYRIPSARLQTWDYASNGMYFITICTAHRECFFGDIVETRCIASPIASPSGVSASADAFAEPEFHMELNDLGRVAETEWHRTKELRPDMNLELAEFVVMPNHFHGIILIGDNQYNTAEYDVDLNNHKKNKFGPQAKNLASIVRGFKSAVTTFARKNDMPFDWQARFHDHIISTEDEYFRIADYLVNNPNNWQKDKFYIK